MLENTGAYWSVWTHTQRVWMGSEEGGGVGRGGNPAILDAVSSHEKCCLVNVSGINNKLETFSDSWFIDPE